MTSLEEYKMHYKNLTDALKFLQEEDRKLHKDYKGGSTITPRPSTLTISKRVFWLLHRTAARIENTEPIYEVDDIKTFTMKNGVVLNIDFLDKNDNNRESMEKQDKEVWFTTPERKEYTITTPPNENGKYIVPEVEEIPQKHWGKICTNKTIMWDVE